MRKILPSLIFFAALLATCLCLQPDAHVAFSRNVSSSESDVGSTNDEVSITGALQDNEPNRTASKMSRIGKAIRKELTPKPPIYHAKKAKLHAEWAGRNALQMATDVPKFTMAGLQGSLRSHGKILQSIHGRQPDMVVGYATAIVALPACGLMLGAGSSAIAAIDVAFDTVCSFHHSLLFPLSKAYYHCCRISDKADKIERHVASYNRYEATRIAREKRFTHNESNGRKVLSLREPAT